jgi:hypothetical protein
MTKAARKVIERGWYLIHCEPSAKTPSYSWNVEATNDESALKVWLDGTAYNPAVYLKKSNLTVLDIDSGLTDDAQALRFATIVLNTETMIVRSGKGYHFYFSGSRELLDTKYTNGAVSGDLKHNGYMLAEGAFYRSTGYYYQCINPSISIAPLPKVLMNYGAEKKVKEKKAPVPISAPAKYTFTEPTVMTRKVWANSRHEYLNKRAYLLRIRDGGGVEGITAMLMDICARYCEDGEAYAQQNAGKIRGIAEYNMKYPVSPLYESKGPKPEPAWWSTLRNALPVDTPVPYKSLRCMESLVNIATSMLYGARNPLDITSCKLGSVTCWIRKGSTPSQNMALLPGNSTPNTLNTYPNQNGMSTVNTSTFPPNVSTRKERVRTIEQKARAKKRRAARLKVSL